MGLVLQRRNGTEKNTLLLFLDTGCYDYFQYRMLLLFSVQYVIMMLVGIVHLTDDTGQLTMMCADTVCLTDDTGQLTMTCAGTVCVTGDTGQLTMTCAGTVCLTDDTGQL